MNHQTDPVSCPVCKQNDCMRALIDLAEDNQLLPGLAAPEAPDSPVFSGMNEGLGCVGGLFFGAAFFLSVAFGSLIAAIIFGAFVFFFVAAFLLVFYQRAAARRELEARYAVWEEKMAVWERLWYCSRDSMIFDPHSGKAMPADQLESFIRSSLS